jgi:hypothetical protein
LTPAPNKSLGAPNCQWQANEDRKINGFKGTISTIGRDMKYSLNKVHCVSSFQSLKESSWQNFGT